MRSPLVGQAEIAARLGVKRQTVANWRQRGIGFPRPLRTVAGRPVWTWARIWRWAEETGRLPVVRLPGERV